MHCQAIASRALRCPPRSRSASSAKQIDSLSSASINASSRGARVSAQLSTEDPFGEILAHYSPNNNRFNFKNAKLSHRTASVLCGNGRKNLNSMRTPVLVVLPLHSGRGLMIMVYCVSALCATTPNVLRIDNLMDCSFRMDHAHSHTRAPTFIHTRSVHDIF